MNYYLVDYPKVGSDGLQGVGNLSADDKVYIYYDSLNAQISFSEMMQLRKTQAEINTIDMGDKFFTDPLSVRLAATVGYFLGKSKSNYITVVSTRWALKQICQIQDEFSEGEDRIRLSPCIGSAHGIKNDKSTENAVGTD